MGNRARIGWVLVFMALVLGIASPGFWELRNLLNLLQQSGVTLAPAESRFGQPALPFRDPHGLHIALVESEDRP